MPFSISIVSCCFAFNSCKSFRPIRTLGQWEASFDGPIRKRYWIIGQIFAVFIGYQVQTCNCCYPTHYSTHYLKSWNRFLLVNKSSNQNHKLICAKTKGYFSNSNYNLCTPFKHDIRCASLCGVEFVVTKERREKRAQRESCLKGVRAL